jgi:hypothetical protein
MNIENKNKLTGISKIYYFNSDGNDHNRKVIEDNFYKWKITNYERISCELKNYQDLILDKNLSLTDNQLQYNLLYLKTIIDWYDNCDDPYCIFMGDNVNIDLAEYWSFDWNFLMRCLPYNWDCMQLNVIKSDIISMHLKPKEDEIYKSKCFMVTRQFAKKIKNLHFYDGKYKLHISSNNYGVQEYYYGDINFFLFELGICYMFPIFNTWGNYEDQDEKISSIAIENWWKTKSKLFTVFDKFHYCKSNDSKMKIFLDDDYQNRVYSEALNVKFMSDDQKILWI